MEGPVTTWQWSYNGLTFGDFTNIDVVSAEGLGLPDVRSSDSIRAYGHGEFPGLDLAAGRTVVLELEGMSATDADQATQLASFQSAFTILTTESPLVWQFPGEAAKRINCRPRRRAFKADMPLAVGRLVRLLVELHATDPRIYADTASTLAISFPTGAGTGITFNATANFSFGSATTGGTGIATNDGAVASPWVCVLAGPLTDPRLTNVTADRTLSLTGTIAAGETLVIDSGARTALLNGTSSRYSWIDTTAKWWDLAPGANSLRFTGASGSGTATFTWRSAWL